MEMYIIKANCTNMSDITKVVFGEINAWMEAFRLSRWSDDDRSIDAVYLYTATVSPSGEVVPLQMIWSHDLPLRWSQGYDETNWPDEEG